MVPPSASPPVLPTNPHVPSKSPADRDRLAFGGPLGALAMMCLLPLLTLYLWACVHLNDGALVLPTRDLLARLPLPTQASVFWLAAWFAFQFALDAFLPGRDYTGLVQRDGLRRTYRLNGLLSLVITLGIVGALLATGIVHGTAVVALLGPLLVTSIVFTYLFSLFLYVYGRRGSASPAERLDKVVYDYFMGTELNPRIGRTDLKMFMESKIGMTSWLVLAIMMAHAQYEQTGTVSLPMALVCLFQATYTFDFFWFEEAMLSTWDINNENYGFMLAQAFLVWMPFNFSLQSQYLVYADPHLPLWAVVGVVVLNFTGYYIFRASNLQKHRVKTIPGTRIWGRDPEFIQTQRGSLLLASGWWGLARHSNYLGDLMMALAWCLACGFGHVAPYFYFIYFAPLLIDRERRDDAHCAKKYGSDWERYRERVPSRIVPFIY